MRPTAHLLLLLLHPPRLSPQDSSSTSTSTIWMPSLQLLQWLAFLRRRTLLLPPSPLARGKRKLPRPSRTRLERFQQNRVRSLQRKGTRRRATAGKKWEVVTAASHPPVVLRAVLRASGHGVLFRTPPWEVAAAAAVVVRSFSGALGRSSVPEGKAAGFNLSRPLHLLFLLSFLPFSSPTTGCIFGPCAP
jgi:hypothetical protein